MHILVKSKRSEARNDVKTTFYLDVEDSAIIAGNVTDFLKTAAANGTLEQFGVVTNEIISIHGTVGELEL